MQDKQTDRPRSRAPKPESAYSITLDDGKGWRASKYDDIDAIVAVRDRVEAALVETPVEHQRAAVASVAASLGINVTWTR